MENKLFDENKMYIIRAKDAGVFMGKIVSIGPEKKMMISGIRRLYKWSGALDVSQLAFEGVTNPGGCKFSVRLDDSDLSGVSEYVEYHPMTESAINSLNSVKAWKS